MAYPKTRKLRQGGLFGTPEYYTWQNMLQRCYNSKHKHWHNYGGRGITVCDEWIGGEGDSSAVQCFVRDMGLRPTPKHTLERENNDLEYSKRNCRWATRQQNQNNRRNTVFVTYRGQTMPIADAARLAGSIVNSNQASARIQGGWSPERAVETPPRVK
jgi:hypothetical protein